ncbi:alpha/beta fold hydrolase [uncultured Psychrobacter sp.]|uniref:alpha/beta fold hydrolase n=1 Tax=uncultured Psychrobacter sp. TaxID=259303 RepID=UPI00345A47BF
MKKDILLVPGAWMGDWIWAGLKDNLNKLNYNAYSITLSGLNQQSENKDASLQTHVNDVKSFIEQNKLKNVILVGHSYSGFVIAQVADQVPENIAKLVFIESFLPTNGQTLLQAAGLDVETENQSIADNNGKWPLPTVRELKQETHLTAQMVEYLSQNLMYHPGKSVQEAAAIRAKNIGIPSFFIGGRFSPSAEQKSLYGDIAFHELDGGHWPMLTELEKLTKILDIIIST